MEWNGLKRRVRGMGAILVGLLGLTACGTDLWHDPFAAQKAGRVVYATPEEIQLNQVLPRSYIVAFKSDLQGDARFFADYASEYAAHYQKLQTEFLPYTGVEDINFLTSLDLAADRDNSYTTEIKTPPLNLFWDEKDVEPRLASIAKVTFRTEEEARELLREWADDERIWYAEPNYDGRVNESSFGEYAQTYKDLIGGGQAKNAFWLDQISLVQAFQKLADLGVTLSERPLVAVMDSGIDYEHFALKDNIWQNTGVNQAGCTNDIHGCNTTQAKKGILGNGDIYPVGTTGPGESCTGSATCRHGTHVAGIIAAKPSDEFGGVCPMCQVMAVRIVGKTARGEGSENSIMDSSIIAGFAYISRFKKSGNNAIRVVNASFGKFQRSRTVELLVRQLRASGSGILVVAAAGNEDTMLRQYPAAFNDVIAVANVMSDSGIKHQTSNFGRWVNVSAPGSGPCDGQFNPGIRSSVPGDSWMCTEGSSMSAPIVTGIAGLLLTMNPQMGFSELKDRLVATAEPGIYDQDDNKPYIPRIKQEQFPVPLLGSGVVNAKNAIEYTVPTSRVKISNTERVTSACGVIGGSAGTSWRAWLFLLGPMLFFLHGKRRKNARG